MTEQTRNLLISLTSHMAYMQGQLEAFTQQSDPEDFYWYRESVALRQKVTDALAAPEGKGTPNPSQIRSSLVERVTRDRDETGDYLIIHDTPAPGSSLVERVATAMHPGSFSPEESWGTEARAAIHEVTAALIEWDDSDQLIRTVSDAANWLEQEVER